MKARFAIVLLMCAGAASAQMYKWKDANGVTHFSDTPPAVTVPAKAVQLKSYNTGGSAALPAELAAAAQSRPVTLYTTVGCAGCDQGRTLLQTRGIPYTEKTVNTAEDHAVLKRAGSAGQLPTLLVGRSKQVGYEASTWDTLLSDAGYPLQPMLPSGYQNPAPAPAAPPPGPSAQERATLAAKEAAEQAERARRLPPVNAPPDFQF
jgi:glutaredoxin